MGMKGKERKEEQINLSVALRVIFKPEQLWLPQVIRSTDFFVLFNLRLD